MAARAKRVDESEWRKRIEAWLASGLMQYVWCEQNNVSLKSFRRWRSRLDKAGLKPHQSPKVSASTGFIKVLVKDEGVETPSQPAVHTSALSNHPSSQAIKVQVGKFHVSVPVGFDSDTFRRALAVLNEFA